jgi:hypothetical protein
MQNSAIESFQALKDYCEGEQFKGWDPYDGLNSKLFRATPLKHWDLARLAWIQLFKRNPINLRKLTGVEKDYNAKGVGLFLSGYVKLYNTARKGDLTFGTEDELLQKINELSSLLLSMSAKGYEGHCWGYNFDWQARRLFLFPKNTPTVVATCFCATALFEAYEVTGDEEVLSAALSSANFILKDLNRTDHNGGFLFSYSPLNGNNTVFNASLLGSKLLSYCYKYDQKDEYASEARKSILACVNSQSQDGSWVYGMLPVQNWIDSFHTGFNLDALKVYSEFTSDNSFEQSIEKGTEFYFDNFFESNGRPKYYHDRVFPIDIHCPSQLFVTINRLDLFEEQKDLCDKVLNWTIANMQDRKGYFYYQMKKYVSSKIPYMRWSQAFMFFGMSCYFESLDKTALQD